MSEPETTYVKCYQCGSDWASSPGQSFKCMVCGASLCAPNQDETMRLYYAEVRKKNIKLVYSKKELKSL